MMKIQKGAGGREEYREIFLRKERQPTGILFREYRKDEKRVEKETAILRLPKGTGFDPTLMIPGSWDSLSLEELRQLSVWLEQGRPPNTVTVNYHDSVEAKIGTDKGKPKG